MSSYGFQDLSISPLAYYFVGEDDLSYDAQHNLKFNLEIL